MRRMLHYLFPLLALVVCVVRPSRAEAPQLAVCRDHVCVMSEADYKNLQAFAMRLREYAMSSQKNDEDRDNALSGALQALDSCKARLERNHA